MFLLNVKFCELMRRLRKKNININGKLIEVYNFPKCPIKFKGVCKNCIE